MLITLFEETERVGDFFVIEEVSVNYTYEVVNYESILEDVEYESSFNSSPLTVVISLLVFFKTRNDKFAF